MSLAEAIYERLSATAPLTALIQTRISPDLRRANETLPAVVFVIEDEIRIPLLATSPVAFTARARFECMADQLSDCYAISDEIITSLHGLSNYASASGVTIQRAIFGARTEIGIAPEPPPNDTDAPRVVTVDFLFTFTT